MANIPIAQKLSFTRRASRIQDKDWERHRPFIEELYGKNGGTRKDVIEKLHQRGFTVTEKQLKHILTKWGLKKKISRTDMESILTAKRQREDDGKATQIAYHGLHINEEKLQRAAKRFKIMSARSTDESPNVTSLTTMLPGHIEVLTPEPRTSIEPVEDENEAQETRLGTTSQETSNVPNQGMNHNGTVSPSQLLADNYDNCHVNPQGAEAPLYLQTPLDHQYSKDVSNDVSSPRTGSNQSRLAFHQLKSFFDDWIEMPATPAPDSHLSVRSATPELNKSTSNISEAAQSRYKVVFHGNDPEQIIYPLQMIRSLLKQLLEDHFFESHATFFGSNLNQIASEIQDPSLLQNIENIARWAHHTSAELLEKPATGGGYKTAFATLPYDEYSNSKIKNDRTDPDAQSISRLTGYCDVRTNCTTGGKFQIYVSRGSEAQVMDDHATRQHIVVSAFPKLNSINRTGIRIIIPKQSWHLPLYTTVQTFNMVPSDSEIIRCVERNDIEKFRALLHSGEASPKDVDQSGFSLLSYAMDRGCSEIFRYLLENGACTESCDTYTHRTSLLDCIWRLHLGYVLGGCVYPYHNAIADRAECLEMTRVALDHGCSIEESLPSNPTYPTPLFFLTNSRDGRRAADLKTLFQDLCKLGYSQEVLNDVGQSPLLFAAYRANWPTLTILKLFLMTEADRHATDNFGRGALHNCLALSTSVFESFLEVCRPEITSSPIYAGYADIVDPGNCYWCRFRDPFRPTEAEMDRESETDAESDLEMEEAEMDAESDIEMETEMNTRDSAIYLYCGWRDVDDFDTADLTICAADSYDGEPEPWMGKKRLRLKLTMLLRAGCDPNVIDHYGESPSDYAVQNNVWPQWEWALAHNGWTFNTATQSCERTQG